MIPKIIHQMWIGPPMPEYMEQCRFSWEEHHPDWKRMDWGPLVEDLIGGNRQLTEFGNQDLIDRAQEIAPGHAEQFISDVVRYEILLEFGGIWVDMDFECQKPIDGLLDCEVFMAWEVPNRWLNQAIIGAEPAHHLLQAAVSLLPANVERYQGRAVTKLSGPQFITPIARRHGVTAYPKDWFYPYLWNELDRWEEDFPDAYAVHHWNNRRRRSDATQ